MPRTMGEPLVVVAVNCTLAIVKPLAAVAVAVMAAEEFTASDVAAPGELIETVGALPAVTVTVLVDEVVVAPRLSVAVAVME